MAAISMNEQLIDTEPHQVHTLSAAFLDFVQLHLP
jgi:hypothetical protein